MVPSFFVIIGKEDFVKLFSNFFANNQEKCLESIDIIVCFEVFLWLLTQSMELNAHTVMMVVETPSDH